MTLVTCYNANLLYGLIITVLFRVFDALFDSIPFYLGIKWKYICCKSAQYMNCLLCEVSMFPHPMWSYFDGCSHHICIIHFHLCLPQTHIMWSNYQLSCTIDTNQTDHYQRNHSQLQYININIKKEYLIRLWVPMVLFCFIYFVVHTILIIWFNSLPATELFFSYPAINSNNLSEPSVECDWLNSNLNAILFLEMLYTSKTRSHCQVTIQSDI